MKQIIRVFFAMLISGLILFAGIGVGASEIVPDGKLISICFSPELELYVAVGLSQAGEQPSVVLYTSGEGHIWVQSDFSLNLTKKDFGTAAANGYFIHPQTVLWNPDEHRFVLCIMGEFYVSENGFEWTFLGDAQYNNAESIISAWPYSIVWNGAEYWAVTNQKGVLARSNGSDLLHWNLKFVDAADTSPFTSIVSIPGGSVYSTNAQADSGLWQLESEDRWSLKLDSGEGPFKTLGGVFSSYLNRIVLFGTYGNVNSITTHGSGAVGLFDPEKNAAVDGPKMKLTKLDLAGISPSVPGGIACNIRGEELLAVFMDGSVFRINMTQKEPAQVLNPANWRQVKSDSPIADIGGLPLNGIVYGNGGYVAIGGTPGHLSNAGDDSVGGAIFITEGLEQGYEKAAFLQRDYTSQLTSLHIVGTDEIAIQNEMVQEAYGIEGRDQKGVILKEVIQPLRWSVEGNPEGISVENGNLSIYPNAEKGNVVLRAQTVEGKLVARKTIQIIFNAVPSRVDITDGNHTAVKLQDRNLDLKYTAVVRDQRGDIIPEVPLHWKIENAGESTIEIDQEGRVSIPPDTMPGSFDVIADTESGLAITDKLCVTIKEAPPGLYLTELSGIEGEHNKDSALVVQAKLVNTTPQDLPAVIIVALYEGERLVHIKTGDQIQIAPTGQETVIQERVEYPDHDDFSAKAFVWSSLDNNVPVKHIN